MNKETIVSARLDRVIRKRIIQPGDYSIVPYEDSRCKISITDVKCTNASGDCEIEPESRIFSSDFDGIVLIGDCDSFIDKDFELILQQMCCNETCIATIIYRNNEDTLIKEISCKIELMAVMEEQVLSDWGWVRLHEAALHHKDRGVELVKEKRIADAFRRFSKALKMVVAIEPIDPEVIDEDRVKEIVDLRVKLYNNLAHCQLQYNEYNAALELCNRALKYQADNIKALYRRSLAYAGLHRYEEASTDIQGVLQMDPNDKAAQQKAKALKPHLEKINNDYVNVIKKMFG